MKKNMIRRGMAIVLALLIAINSVTGHSVIPGIVSYADVERAAQVNATTLNIRSGPGTGYAVVDKLTNGAPVTVIGQANGSDGMLWYQIRFLGSGGTERTGYARSDYIRFSVSYTNDMNFESYLSSQGFPESYRPGLRQLHAMYPNWVFIAQQTGLDWNTVIENESLVGRNLVYDGSISSWKSTAEGAYDWENSSWPSFDSGSYVAASSALISYYMDPRNFLDDKYVFQFLLHRYDAAAQNADGLRSMVAGTFLAGSAEVSGSYGNWTDTGNGGSSANDRGPGSGSSSGPGASTQGPGSGSTGSGSGASTQGPGSGSTGGSSGASTQGPGSGSTGSGSGASTQGPGSGSTSSSSGANSQGPSGGGSTGGSGSDVSLQGPGSGSSGGSGSGANSQGPSGGGSTGGNGSDVSLQGPGSGSSGSGSGANSQGPSSGGSTGGGSGVSFQPPGSVASAAGGAGDSRILGSLRTVTDGRQILMTLTSGQTSGPGSTGTGPAERSGPGSTGSGPAGTSGPGSTGPSSSGPGSSSTGPGDVYSGSGAKSGGPGSASSSGPGYTSGGTSGQTVDYVGIIMNAAAQSGVNPYVLASMIIQEQGTSGNGGSISGNYSGYRGYYNFFNIEAYRSGDMEAVERGLWYASQSGSYGRPWNSIDKSIIGGALYYGTNYVSVGQDTFYLKKFNVQGSNIYKHQYMTNVQGAASEGAKISEAYSSQLKQTAALQFKIPVYQNMPAQACPKPVGDGSPNNKLSGLAVDGFAITPTFNRDITVYDLIVNSSVSEIGVYATAYSDTASISGTGIISLQSGNNEIHISVRAQNGDVRDYLIRVVKRDNGPAYDSSVNLGSGGGPSSSGPGSSGGTGPSSSTGSSSGPGYSSGPGSSSSTGSSSGPGYSGGSGPSASPGGAGPGGSSGAVPGGGPGSAGGSSSGGGASGPGGGNVTVVP